MFSGRNTIIFALALWPMGAAFAQQAVPPTGKVSSKPTAERVTALQVNPAQVTLNGPYTVSRLVVEGVLPNGRTRDLSTEATFTFAAPQIAEKDEEGFLRPLKDGKTNLTIQYQGKTRTLSVVVSGMAKPAPPRFLADVLPVLTRSGCNMGACHGAAQGKGGFKLSLLGYDPDFDHESIARAANARRIARSQPENSLLLRKATMGVAHKGGLRFKVGSPEYRLLRDWIASGLPAPDPKEAKVEALTVFPPTRTLSLGQTQRFRVTARYSDGTTRDVTDQTVFTASESAVAAVAPDGEATVMGPGEGAAIIRYQGLVAMASVISPYNPPKSGVQDTPSKIQNPKSKIPTIDSLVQRKLDALGLTPAERCSDSDFLRRAYLDVIGLLPTPNEARAFLADKDPQKRNRLIEALLNRPEYVDYWTLKWGDILRSNRNKLNEKGMLAFNQWIRHSVANNKPWNQFARELILAQGSAYSDGASNYFRTVNGPNEMAETTAQAFLGVRMQCAKCHNHPFDRWTQNQYYQMSAFFARVRKKGGERPAEQVVYVANEGEVQHPKTQQNVTPCALNDRPIPADYQEDRRQALADWLTSDKNPFFARVLVNRVWRHFMGRGFVEPVDDLRITNPASNEPLFAALTQGFIQNGYDLKGLMRSILRSQTYQRSPIPQKGSERDTKFHSYYAFKRLSAETLLDALGSATGVQEKFGGYPQGTRAAELPDTSVGSYFLDLFGRPARNSTCECERTDDPNLGQLLHLMNNAGLNARIGDKGGRVAQLIAAKRSDRKVVEELYLATFARFPTAPEMRRALFALAVFPTRQQGAEDLLWTLLNSKEFLFNH